MELASEGDNATSQLLLHLSSESDLEGAIRDIDAVARLRRVELHFAASFQSQDATRFIESLCRRPTLQQLRLASEVGGNLANYYCFPVSLLCTILDLATGLKSMDLQGLELSGKEEQFLMVEESLRNHSNLTDIVCTSWLSEEARMKENMSLDQLVKALAASRSLQSICLRPAFTFGGLSDTSVGLLGTMPSLQRLDIAKCNLSDSNMVALANVLQENSVLEELRITVRLGEPGIRSIAELLSKANSALQIIVIHDTNTTATAEVESSESSSDLHNTPSSSSSPDADTTTQGENDDHDHYTQVARALQDNQTLKHLALFGAKLSGAGQASFVEMIKKNCTLESLSLLDLRDDLKSQIDMYTLLNRSGRKELLTSAAGRSDWVASMALVSDDLNCLFYLINTKPSLCDLESQDKDTKKRGQKDASKSEKKHRTL